MNEWSAEISEAIGDNADKIIEVMLKLYRKGATKAYLQEVKKTFAFLVTGG